MNILDKILILIIIIFLIKYISNKSILDILKKTFNNIKKTCNNNIIKIQKKKIKHDNKKNSEEQLRQDSLDNFLQRNVNKNSEEYLMIDSSTKGTVLSLKDRENLLHFLYNQLNGKIHKIKEIEFLNKLVSYKNQIGYELKTFQIQGKYYYKKKFIGYILLQYELLFIVDENKSEIFLQPNLLNGDFGNYEITRIFLINILNKKLKSKKLDNKYIDNKYIDNYETNIDSINSLIPDEINISSQESFSSITFS